MNTPTFVRHKFARQTLALAVPVLAIPSLFAQFTPTGAGPYDYADTANWSGGTINNTFSSDPVADQVVYFAADRTLSSGWSIANTTTFSRTFLGSGADRTVTLGGNISLGSSTTNSNLVTLGSLTDGQRLNINIGSSNRTFSTGTNRTLEVLNVVSGGGTAGIIKNGVGTLKLTNTANTFAGNISIGGGSPNVTGGVLEVTKIADRGVASSIGTGTRITFGGVGASGTLRYVGAGDSSDRVFTIGGAGATIESSGSGALKFTDTANLDTSPSTASRAITFGGTNSGDNTFAPNINDQGTGKLSVAKKDAGRWILSGTNTYTGTTTIDAGTLQLGSNTAGGNGSNLILNGGTFATGDFSETFGTLALNGDATIDFSGLDSSLDFADSSGVTWGESISLSIVNFTAGDSIRFGSTFEGLSGSQLGKITINGFTAEIDELGYLSASAVPEPSSFAAMAGIGGLLVAAGARRRR